MTRALCRRAGRGYPACSRVRQWRNWQTHQLEGLAGASPWRFESSLPHQFCSARLRLAARACFRPSCPPWGSLRVSRHVRAQPTPRSTARRGRRGSGTLRGAQKSISCLHAHQSGRHSGRDAATPREEDTVERCFAAVPARQGEELARRLEAVIGDHQHEVLGSVACEERRDQAIRELVVALERREGGGALRLREAQVRRIAVGRLHAGPQLVGGAIDSREQQHEELRPRRRLDLERDTRLRRRDLKDAKELLDAFGEPLVDGLEEGAGFGGLALVAPEAGEAGGDAQLEGACLLLGREVEGTSSRCPASSSRWRSPLPELSTICSSGRPARPSRPSPAIPGIWAAKSA